MSSLHSDQSALYRFYPCAYVPSRIDTQLLYFRYKTAKERAEFVDFTIKALPMGSYIDCPDRELFFSRAGHVSGEDRPFNWDGCLSLSWYYKAGDDGRGDRFMINHTAFSSIDNKMSKFSRNIEGLFSERRKVICDSGGFQLKTGNTDFIDPIELAEYYAAYVDEGVALDIPIVTGHRGLMERALKVQNKNTKLMLRHLPEDFSLANVSHGFNYEDYQWFRSRLYETEETPILCIPSSLILPEIQSIDRLMYHLTHGMQYPQYHLLGVYNTSWLPLAIRATHLLSKQQNREILLTSDASSAVYSAKSLRWHKQMHPYNSVTRWPIGDTAGIGYFTSPHNEVGCRCEVCETIKYTDVYKLLPDITTSPYLTRHNELETLRWADQVCYAAANMDDKDYFEFCKMQTGNKRTHNTLAKAFDYMNRCLQDGWEKAHTHYKPHLHSLFTPKMKSSHVFENSHDALSVDDDVDELNKRMDIVLKRYEYFHKHGKRPAF